MEQENNQRKRIFGFDIGTSSLGWSVIKPEYLNEDGEVLQKFKLIGSGVYLFKEPIEPKSKVLLNAKRRTSRLARRGNNRKYNRKLKIKQLLQEYNIVSEQQLECNAEDYIFTVKKSTLTPYELRVNALDKQISKEELARVLFHCAKYRGFKSTKKDKKIALEENNKATKEKEDDKAKELGKVLKAGAENEKLLKEGNFRTMTELMLKRAEKDDINKNIHNRAGDYGNSILREYVQAEVGLILKKQREFYPELNDEFEKKYNYIAFEQRPLKGFFDKIGICTLFGHEEAMQKYNLKKEDIKRAPKRSISAEEFVALSRLSNLSFSKNNKKSFLTAEQIEKLMNLAREKKSKDKKITYYEAREVIELDKDDIFYGLSYKKVVKKPKSGEVVEENEVIDEKQKQKDLKEFEKGKLIELSSFHGLKDALANSFENLTKEQRDIISEAVTYYKQPNDIDKYLKERNVYEIVKQDIENIYNLDFTEVINYSHKALYILLPIMKEMAEGKYNDYKTKNNVEKPIDVHYSIELAREQGTLPKQEEKSKFNLLPALAYLDERNIDTPISPSVRRAITSFRHVFNSLVKKYGKPDGCNFELLREMYGKDQKSNKTADIESKTIINETIHAEAKKLDADFTAVKLWKQQGCDCLYCQQKITADDMKVKGKIEVDHILPYSQTFNDSLDNKVAVHSTCNQNKGNRTPYMWYSETGKNWHVFENFVMSKKQSLGRRKIDNLITTKAGDELLDSFTNRQFSESAYIARFIKNYVEDFFNFERTGRNVLVVNGQITNLLRNIHNLTKYRAKEDCEKHKENLEKKFLSYKKYLEEGKKLSESELEQKLQELESRKEANLKNADKNYIGDKHHAIDAILVALSSNKLIHKVSSVLRSVNNTPEDNKRGKKAKGYLHKIFRKNGVIVTANLEEEIRNYIDKNKIFISKQFSGPKYNGAIHEETVYGSIKLGSINPVNENFDKTFIDRDFDIPTQRVSVAEIKSYDDLAKTIKIGENKKTQYSYYQYILNDTAKKAIEDWILLKEQKKNDKELEVSEFPYFEDKNGNKNVIRSVTKILNNTSISIMYKLHNTNKDGIKKFVGYVKPDHKVRTDIFSTINKKGKQEYYLRPVTLADLTLLKSTSSELEDNILNLSKGNKLERAEGDEKYKFMFSLHSGEAFSFLEKDKEDNEFEKIVYLCGYATGDNKLEYKNDCSSKKETGREYVSILSAKGLTKIKLNHLGDVIKRVTQEDYVCPVKEYKNYLESIKLKNQKATLQSIES